MDLNPLSLLNGGPFLPELFHHLTPHKERLTGQLIDSLLGLLLEHEQSKAPLYGGGLLH